MRVLHVIDELSDSSLARQLWLLAPEQVRQGLDVHLCVLGPCGWAREMSELGISPHVLGERRLWSPAVAGRLGNVIQRLGAPLVNTWSTWATATVGLMGGSKLGRAWVVVADARAPSAVPGPQGVPRGRTWLAWAVEHWLWRRAAAVVFLHLGGEAGLPSRTRPGPPVRCIRPAVVSTDAQVSRSAALRVLGFPADARVVLAAGPLSAQRRLKELAWATDLLRVVRSDLHWTIIGRGQYRRRLEHYLHQCRLSESGRFLDDTRSAEPLRPHADLYWSASDCDTLPLAMVEAMADGLPVVAADTLAHRELVSSGQNGLLVQVGDRAGYARAALKLIENRELAQQMGLAGKAYVLREFSLGRMVAEYGRLYDEMAA